MDNKEDKISFDLSALSLEELIEVYENIEDFLHYLSDNKIVIEDEEGSEEND